jgi:hypothetical protein
MFILQFIQHLRSCTRGIQCLVFLHDYSASQLIILVYISVCFLFFSMPVLTCLCGVINIHFYCKLAVSMHKCMCQLPLTKEGSNISYSFLEWVLLIIKYHDFINPLRYKYSASHSKVAPKNVALQKEQKCNAFACHTCMKCGCHKRCWKFPP